MVHKTEIHDLITSLQGLESVNLQYVILIDEEIYHIDREFHNENDWITAVWPLMDPRLVKGKT